MTIYKMTMTHYNYWFSCDRDGWSDKVRYFSTKEKAERWQAENAEYANEFDSDTAKNEGHLPTFKIEEIEVE